MNIVLFPTPVLATLPEMDGFSPGENEIKFPDSEERFYY